MISEDIKKRLQELKREDFIWVIYIGIIFLSWLSNSLEKDYFLNNNYQSKEKYRQIIIIIFSVLVLVYLYFLKSSYESVQELKPTDSIKKKRLVTLSFFGSLFVFLSGIIFLYIAITDEELNIEVAFN